MQKKRWVRLFSWVALVAFIGVMVGTVVISYVEAAKSSGQIRQEKEEKQDELKDKEKEAKTLQEEIWELIDEIEQFEEQIGSMQNEIDKTQRDLDIATAECDEQEAHYYDRVRLMVEKGDESYLEVFLDSKSFSDLYERMEIVKAVAEYDKKLWEDLKAKRDEVQAKKDELVAQKEELEEMKKESEAKRARLEAKLSENKAIRAQIEAEIDQLEEDFKKQRAIEEAAWAEANKNRGNSAFVGGEFLFPTRTTYITSYYGYRVHPVYGTQRFHSGVDIGASMGEAIYAANDGKVITSGFNTGGYGNYIMIDHGGGYVSLYAHNSQNLVSVGQTVSRGDVIGYVGTKGVSTGPHLHFEIRVNGATVNPLPLIQ